MKPLVLVIGTRAEAIKLIPLYLALKKSDFPAILCATFQHSEMLQQVCDLFSVKPDYDLNIMVQNQDVFHVNIEVLKKIRWVYSKINPSLVIVHGDTTTTFASALSAFYMQIPVAHVEAGLRTGNMYAPFPEEMNRRVVGQIATYHFAPTAFSTANVLSEGVARESVFCTGNTIVDALSFIRNKILSKEILPCSKLQLKVDECRRKRKKMVLLTAHRRESFDGGLTRVFRTMRQFAESHPDVFIFYPKHPNPNVLSAVEESGIKEVKNIFLSNHLLYKDMVYLLMSVDWVVTDSGGLQEEAVSLGRRVLCLRDVTERSEGIWEGSEVLVGTDPGRILRGMQEFYRMDDAKIDPSTIYGDGHACRRIVSILKSKLNFQKSVSFSLDEAFINDMKSYKKGLRLNV